MIPLKRHPWPPARLPTGRVRHFFDPDKQAGKAIADSLQWEGRIAWDIYLYYAPGVEMIGLYHR